MIEAINDKYKLVSSAEMEKRADAEISSSGKEYSDYERQRLEYLECEDDVVNFLYKTIEIVEKDEQSVVKDDEQGIDLSDEEIVND